MLEAEIVARFFVQRDGSGGDFGQERRRRQRGESLRVVRWLKSTEAGRLYLEVHPNDDRRRYSAHLPAGHYDPALLPSLSSSFHRSVSGTGNLRIATDWVRGEKEQGALIEQIRALVRDPPQGGTP